MQSGSEEEEQSRKEAGILPSAVRSLKMEVCQNESERLKRVMYRG